MKELMANSFRPILLSEKKRRPAKKKRTFSAFYKQQIQFKAKVESTAKSKREAAEQQELSNGRAAHVKANKHSLVILERLKDQNRTERNVSPEVHERLYHNQTLVATSKKNRQLSQETMSPAGL